MLRNNLGTSMHPPPTNITTRFQRLTTIFKPWKLDLGALKRDYSMTWWTAFLYSVIVSFLPKARNQKEVDMMAIHNFHISYRGTRAEDTHFQRIKHGRNERPLHMTNHTFASDKQVQQVFILPKTNKQKPCEATLTRGNSEAKYVGIPAGNHFQCFFESTVCLLNFPVTYGTWAFQLIHLYAITALDEKHNWSLQLLSELLRYTHTGAELKASPILSPPSFPPS